MQDKEVLQCLLPIYFYPWKEAIYVETILCRDEPRLVPMSRTRASYRATKSSVSSPELYAIGEEIEDEELTFERKRRVLERLRTVVTVESQGDPQWLSIEILGHSRRVSLKNPSAGGSKIDTKRLPLLFRTSRTTSKKRGSLSISGISISHLVVQECSCESCVAEARIINADALDTEADKYYTDYVALWLRYTQDDRKQNARPCLPPRKRWGV